MEENANLFACLFAETSRLGAAGKVHLISPRTAQWQQYIYIRERDPEDIAGLGREQS